MPQVQSDKTRVSIAQKMVNWLFREGELALSFSEWTKLLSATIIKNNPQFSQDFFDALSQKISTSFADPDLSDIKKEIILYNALSYLAFANPQANQVISIKGIDYTIEKIQLTSGWLSAPYYAYGLRALTDQNAQSYLIFQGTTTPSDNGFLAGLLADTRPDGAIGAQLYARGQEKIQQWVDEEYRRTQKRVICTGQSLGGAMSLHAHIHQPNEVDFFVVNPPSLTSREKRMHEAQPCEQGSDDPRTLRVVSHTKDPVWGLGSCCFPHGTEVYRYGDNDEGKLVAHARAADCSAQNPEPEFVPHAGEPIKNRYWKTLKPFLFIGVLILHAIALPIRIIIQITHEIGKLFANGNPSSATQEVSSPNDVEEGMTSSYSRMKSYNSMEGKKDLATGEKPEHTDPLFSEASSQPLDGTAKALDADSSEPRSHSGNP